MLLLAWNLCAITVYLKSLAFLAVVATQQLLTLVDPQVQASLHRVRWEPAGVICAQETPWHS
mgnify:CR=1 FL=1